MIKKLWEEYKHNIQKYKTIKQNAKNLGGAAQWCTQLKIGTYQS